MIKTETYPDGVVCLRPVGDLTWDSATALRHAVHDVLSPSMLVELDLQDVASIDAVGLSALLGSVRLIRSVAGEVQVSNIPPAVQSRLDMLGIDLRFVGAKGTGEAA